MRAIAHGAGEAGCRVRSPRTSLMAVNRLWIYMQVIIVICVVASFVIALIKL